MPASAGTAKAKSMFEKLGGTKSIETVVEAFYKRVLADAELKPFFARTNMKWLKMRQVQFFTQALGGPSIYKGKGMKEAHKNMKIEKKHFDHVAMHLYETLKALGITEPDIKVVIDTVASLAPEIVNR